MRESLTWAFSGTPKHFRPLTVFACHRAVHHTVLPDAIELAFAVELMHNMSLIIDDVLDRSEERRGVATVQQKYGSLPALMASGYLVADAFDAFAEDPFAIRHLSELLRRLGAAECLQWRLRRQPLGVEDWRRIAGEDTGSMFEICAVLGARSERLRQYGHLLGVLYHGCDDVGDQRGLAALGGGGEEDIRDGILTLPAALAIRDPRIREPVRHRRRRPATACRPGRCLPSSARRCRSSYSTGSPTQRAGEADTLRRRPDPAADARRPGSSALPSLTRLGGGGRGDPAQPGAPARCAGRRATQDAARSSQPVAVDHADAAHT